MSGTHRKYTAEFKNRILNEIERGKPAAEVCREQGIHPSLIPKWRKVRDENPGNAFQGNGNTYKESARIAELERKVGQLVLEIDFLKNVLEASKKRLAEERRQKELKGDIK
jgi:transposase